MSNKFLYEVRPVKPVVTTDGRSMRRPFSSLLSKEEVTAYMKSANIYRRFPDITEPIKVTGATLDELHREKFNVVVTDTEAPEEITGEDNIDTSENPEKGIEEVIEEPVEESPVEESVIEDAQEEVVEESVVEEDVVEEPVISEEVQEEKITETVTEEPDEEVIETVEEKKIEEVIEEPVEETPVEEAVIEDAQEDQDEDSAPVVTAEAVLQETTSVAPKVATIQMNHGYHNNKKKHHR